MTSESTLTASREEQPTGKAFESIQELGCEDESESEAIMDGNEIAQKKADQARRERKSLAKNETTAVNRLRIFTFGVLISTAVVACLGVYFYTSRDEQQDFEYVFESSAEQVIQSFHASVSRIWAGADSLAIGITSHALDTGAKFPFVTVPHWEVRGANARALTQSVAFNWFPMIQEEDREEWEAYVTRQITKDDLQNRAVARENIYIARQDAFFGLEPVVQEPPPQGGLFLRNFSSSLTTIKGEIQPNNTGPYMTFYQTSPVHDTPALPTLNVFTLPPLIGGLKDVLQNQMVYLSPCVEPSGMFHRELGRGQFRHNQETYLGDAISPFIYPVFDSFNEDNRTMVGTVLSNIYWRLHFQNILGTNTRGILVVLSNSHNQTFSYQINGPEVEYLGKGDRHDPRFDDYLVSADIADYLESHASVMRQGYTTVPLTKTGVHYTLSIYPTAEMEADYLTKNPAVFAMVVAVVFLFTSLVFLFYNCAVDHRQRVVVDRAVKSASVISNLFPETFKEELINNESTKQPKKDRKDTWKNSSTKSTSACVPEPVTARQKLAKKYPETTILFADIAGFTAWSSDREPEAVFELLETLYEAFDALACAHKVFKVETIGDCYLAITGVPNPQPDHAYRMAKFARDCMHQVNDILPKLASTLGEDTLELGFRVGLHSGKVTAGVLRGDKARFQLFGDTVNVASRMESNGSKGKIHVSEAFYNELKALNKSHLLVEREDKIHAKGKGVITTYFFIDDFVNSLKGCGSITHSNASQNSMDSRGLHH